MYSRKHCRGNDPWREEGVASNMRETTRDKPAQHQRHSALARPSPRLYACVCVCACACGCSRASACVRVMMRLDSGEREQIHGDIGQVIGVPTGKCA